MTALWDEFATYENFLLAWQRTVNCSSRMVRDQLGLRVFAHNLQANLEDLITRLQDEGFPFVASPDHKVYVPKPSQTLRTMSLMSVPDLIVYQAAVNVIADRTQLAMVTHEDQHVWGNLYAGHGKRWMLKRWRTQYNRYVQYIERFYRAGNPWIASTDIVAFYDTIDHERLLAIIAEFCGQDGKFAKLFGECLKTWSAHTPFANIGRGIPQGTNASDFLANLYLHNIDCEMISHGYHYARYVDDVRILGPDITTAQRGLIHFDLELKRAGLIAQITKTSIHQIEDIKKEILRLSFRITDLTGTGLPTLLAIPLPATAEQSESVSEFLHKTSSDLLLALGLTGSLTIA
jgi:retron-type reverse transcriptase